MSNIPEHDQTLIKIAEGYSKQIIEWLHDMQKYPACSQHYYTMALGLTYSFVVLVNKCESTDAESAIENIDSETSAAIFGVYCQKCRKTLTPREVVLVQEGCIEMDYCKDCAPGQ